MEFSRDAEDEALAGRLERFAQEKLSSAGAALEERRELPHDFYRMLGSAGWYRYLVPKVHGGVFDDPLCYPLCLIREAFARQCSFASAAFGVQGLGSYPIALAGAEALGRKYLPEVASGALIAAFAMTEREAGSDAAGIETTAERSGDHYVLNGSKVFISNAGVAGLYTVIARTSPERSAKALSAFAVDAETPGFEVVRRMEVVSFDVLGELRFEDCAVPVGNLLGREGDGFRLAMKTLDLFRPTVGAHAVGLAEAAFDAALKRAKTREQFGRKLASFQGVGFKLADMASDIHAARLMVYRAAKAKDTGAPDIPYRASMAKLFATEAAQRVVDGAVQIHGGWGVSKEFPLERYYREVRALRLYEGTSEIQKLVIAKQVLEKDRLD